MKKIAFIILLIAACPVLAQNCKYQTNEVDKFTKQLVKHTKNEKVIATFYTVGEFSLKKVDTTYYILFDYTINSYSTIDDISIKNGDKLMFLLDNGDNITVSSAENINGTKKTIVGIPPVYECKLQNVSYNITKQQLEQLLRYKVKSIRFYKTEASGKQNFTDNDIKNKNQDDIQTLVKCIL